MGWRAMPDEPRPLFSFGERNHLTRIHLKLGLENLGFVVVEDGDDLSLVGAKPLECVPLTKS
jgi:hypothetical protein